MADISASSGAYAPSAAHPIDSLALHDASLTWSNLPMSANLRLTANMADSTAPANMPADPIKLHMRAMNSLSTCQRELRQQVPCYSVARMYLELAQQAIAALEAIETGAAR